VDEVTVTKWLKQEGDTINELEPLLEVNTDKVDTEIPAPATGTVLKIVAQEGIAAKVGELLAIIGKPGEALTFQILQTSVQSQSRKSKSEPSTTCNLSRPSTDLGFISPVVARVAAEHGVDLSQVNGTGLNGRITKNDVLAFVSGRKSKVDRSKNSPPCSRLQPSNLPTWKATTNKTHHHPKSDRRAYGGIQAHLTACADRDGSGYERVGKHRAANKAAFERDGVNLTFTAYFMMAIVAGLKAYPQTNSSWTDEGLLVHKNVNIGMAVSLGEDGLIVPVIKTAEDLSLLAMARAVNDLANRARTKKLQPDEVKGGTFTLTNHGVSGSLFAFPVINQPQAGILGVGAMQKRVVVIPAKDGAGDDAIAIRPMVYMSFVFDHRILDGASADWFLAKVKDTLENWA
jgi:2-oxoisovalerate dehydrogenase E2 component (dihydrolipoyl transacylase)